MLRMTICRGVAKGVGGRTDGEAAKGGATVQLRIRAVGRARSTVGPSCSRVFTGHFFLHIQIYVSSVLFHIR